MGFYGIPWIPAIKIKHFELTLFQTTMISVGTNFPWPKHSRFDVLSWLATLRTPRLCKGSSIFLPNPYDVGVVGLPLIHVFKIWFSCWHGTLKTARGEGVRKSFCIFCSKPLQYERVFIDSPWPKHLRFDILGWHGTSRTLRVCGGSSVFCFKPLQ